MGGSPWPQRSSWPASSRAPSRSPFLSPKTPFLLCFLSQNVDQCPLLDLLSSPLRVRPPRAPTPFLLPLFARFGTFRVLSRLPQPHLTPPRGIRCSFMSEKVWCGPKRSFFRALLAAAWCLVFPCFPLFSSSRCACHCPHKKVLALALFLFMHLLFRFIRALWYGPRRRGRRLRRSLGCPKMPVKRAKSACLPTTNSPLGSHPCSLIALPRCKSSLSFLKLTCLLLLLTF